MDCPIKATDKKWDPVIEVGRALEFCFLVFPRINFHSNQKERKIIRPECILDIDRTWMGVMYVQSSLWVADKFL